MYTASFSMMAGSTALKSASGNLLSKVSSFAFDSLLEASEVCWLAGSVLAGSLIRTFSTPDKQQNDENKTIS